MSWLSRYAGRYGERGDLRCGGCDRQSGWGGVGAARRALPRGGPFAGEAGAGVRQDGARGDLFGRFERGAGRGGVGTAGGGGRLVLPSSVYGYGVPRTSRVAETHAREPHTRKGKYRKEQEDLVMEAHAPGALQGMIVRLPDFYGPHADLGLANPIFRAALAGKTANWAGPVNTEHEFVYVPDTGPV